ncbi:helix-turn-helix domain-containing protein [Bdellovibrio sp. HCB117]|uniref:helix-turn-helix domain-containing protein n=1 Tax=Bdellovibrio sp. HCB117 TaxID=3394359 RepID=UPI0039B5292A
MEHSRYLETIKKVLRTREVTYSELAVHLKMTESGVKKMLNAKDISFRRILQICDALGILPGQLFSLSEKSFIAEVTLSKQQEEALLKQRSLLAVYWRLTVEGRDLSEIEGLQKLSKTELKKILDKLVSLELLSLKRGTYTPRHVGKFKWNEETKLVKILNQEWSELTLQRALEKKKGSLHRLVSMKLSEESYARLQQGLTKVLDEAVQNSENEELTLSKKQMHNFTALVATVAQGVLDT